MRNRKMTGDGAWEHLETRPARKPGTLSTVETNLYRSLRKLDKRLVRQDWHIATVLCANGSTVGPSDMRIIANPRNAYLADPIPLTGRPNEFLVEDMDWQLGRAYISHLRIDDQDRFWISRKVIWDREHLSFPMNFIYDDRLFVAPESTKNGVTRLWTYCADTLIAEDAGFLIDEPLYDPVILEEEGRWLLLGMTDSPHRELALYESDSPLGTWRRIALINATGLRRPGGAALHAEELIIPMQGESRGYGSELFFCHLALQPHPKLEVRSRFDPPLPYLGLHSFAQGRGYALVDLQYDIFHTPALKRRLLHPRWSASKGPNNGAC